MTTVAKTIMDATLKDRMPKTYTVSETIGLMAIKLRKRIANINQVKMIPCTYIASFLDTDDS